MFDVPDNFDIWNAHDVAASMRLERLPKCSICDNHIQDETAFCHNGVWICQSCINENMEEVPDDE